MSFFGDLLGGQAANQAAQWNAKVMERNALIKQQEAEQIMSVHNNYSVPRFDRTVEEIMSQTEVSYLSKGVVLEGTPVEVLYLQRLELETDKDIMQYNAENARDQKYNESIMMQAEADMERWRGKVAKKRSYFEAGQSLLTTAAMFG
jgi:hypothetical protein